MEKTRPRKANSYGKSVKETYRGLPIDETNCADLLRVKRIDFNHLWRRPSRVGEGQWGQFICAMGQLSRVAVANQVAVGELLFQPGELFCIATHKVLFSIFITHFEMGGPDSKAMNKARQCLRFTRAALDYFREYPVYGNDNLRNGLHEKRILETIDFVKGKAAENKRDTRYEASLSRVHETRVEASRHLTENDFLMFREESNKSLFQGVNVRSLTRSRWPL